MVFQAEYPPQENCKSVIEALIMSNKMHEEDAGSLMVGSHRRVHGGFLELYTEGVGSFVEGMERV